MKTDLPSPWLIFDVSKDDDGWPSTPRLGPEFYLTRDSSQDPIIDSIHVVTTNLALSE